MKSDRRHELEKNALADSLGGGIQAVQPMLPLILGGIAVLVVGSLGYAMYSSSKKAKAASAWTNYYFNLASEDPDKFVAVADDFPGSTAAGWARQTAGAAYLSQGIQSLYRNRAEGEKLLNQAIEAFEDASQATEPELRNKALFCLAQANEALGQLGKAAEGYEAVSKSTEFPALAVDAGKRLDYIQSDAGKNFYAWFDKLDPKPDSPIDLSGDLSLPPSSPAGMQFDPIGGLNLDFPTSEEPMMKLDPADLPPLPGDEPTPATEAAPEATPASEPPAVKAPATPAAEPTPAAETPAIEVPASETLAPETPATEIPVSETPATEIPLTEPAADAPAGGTGQ